MLTSACGYQRRLEVEHALHKLRTHNQFLSSRVHTLEANLGPDKTATADHDAVAPRRVRDDMAPQSPPTGAALYTIAASPFLTPRAVRNGRVAAIREARFHEAAPPGTPDAAWVSPASTITDDVEADEGDRAGTTARSRVAAGSLRPPQTPHRPPGNGPHGFPPVSPSHATVRTPQSNAHLYEATTPPRAIAAAAAAAAAAEEQVATLQQRIGQLEEELRNTRQQHARAIATSAKQLKEAHAAGQQRAAECEELRAQVDGLARDLAEARALMGDNSGGTGAADASTEHANPTTPRRASGMVPGQASLVRAAIANASGASPGVAGQLLELSNVSTPASGTSSFDGSVGSSRVTELEAQVAMLSVTVEQQREELEALRRQDAPTKRPDAEELAVQVEDLQRRLRQTETALAACRREVVAQAAAMATATSDPAAKGEATGRDGDTAAARVTELQLELRSCRQAHEADVVALQRQLSDALAAADASGTELAAARASITELQALNTEAERGRVDALAQANELRASTSARVAAVEARCVALQSQLDDTHTEADTLRAAVADAEEARKQAVAGRQSATARASDMEAAVRQREDDIAALRLQLRQAEAACDVALGQVAAAEAAAQANEHKDTAQASAVAEQLSSLRRQLALAEQARDEALEQSRVCTADQVAAAEQATAAYRELEAERDALVAACEAAQAAAAAASHPTPATPVRDAATPIRDAATPGSRRGWAGDMDVSSPSTGAAAFESPQWQHATSTSRLRTALAVVRVYETCLRDLCGVSSGHARAVQRRMVLLQRGASSSRRSGGRCGSGAGGSAGTVVRRRGSTHSTASTASTAKERARRGGDSVVLQHDAEHWRRRCDGLCQELLDVYDYVLQHLAAAQQLGTIVTAIREDPVAVVDGGVACVVPVLPSATADGDGDGDDSARDNAGSVNESDADGDEPVWGGLGRSQKAAHSAQAIVCRLRNDADALRTQVQASSLRLAAAQRQLSNVRRAKASNTSIARQATSLGGSATRKDAYVRVLLTAIAALLCVLVVQRAVTGGGETSGRPVYPLPT